MKKLIILIALIMGSASLAYSQNSEYPGWGTYLTPWEISDIADAGNYIWAATTSEVIKLDKSKGIRSHYHFNNMEMPLPDYNLTKITCDTNESPWVVNNLVGLLHWTEDNQWNLVQSTNDILRDIIIDVVVDKDNIVWIAYLNRLVKYNNGKTTVFDESNSGINGLINSLAMDADDNLWMGVSLSAPGASLLSVPDYENLVQYDNENWTSYNSSSTGLDPFLISNIKTDGQGTIWMIGNSGTFGASNVNTLVSFDGTDWKVHELPENIDSYKVALEIENKNNIWIGGAESGLIQYKNSSWSVYNMENSELSSNNISSIVIDDDGTKWIGTDAGLVAFHEGTINKQGETSSLNFNNNILDFEIFPNPVNDILILKLSEDLVGSNTVLYSAQGKLLKSSPADKTRNQIDVSGFPDGIYFIGIKSNQKIQTIKFVKQ